MNRGDSRSFCLTGEASEFVRPTWLACCWARSRPLPPAEGTGYAPNSVVIGPNIDLAAGVDSRNRSPKKPQQRCLQRMRCVP